MSALNKHTLPTLTTEQELTHARAWRDHKDTKARDAIIMSNLRFAMEEISKRHRTAERDDLEQEAVMLMMVALDRFDPERGVRFITYAKMYIRLGIEQAERATLLITLPVDAFQSVINSATPRVSDATVEAASRAFDVVSLDEPAYGFDREKNRILARAGGTKRLEHMATTSPLPGKDDTAERAESMILACTPTEKFIMTRRFIEDRSIQYVADELGVSRTSVSMMQTAACERLRSVGRSDAPLASDPFWLEEANAVRRRFGGQVVQMATLRSWARLRYAINPRGYLRHVLLWMALEGRASLQGESVCVMASKSVAWRRAKEHKAG